MICPICGYNASADSQFCSQCGAPLSIETFSQDSPNYSRPAVSPNAPTMKIPHHASPEDTARFLESDFEEEPESASEASVEEAPQAEATSESENATNSSASEPACDMQNQQGDLELQLDIDEPEPACANPDETSSLPSINTNATVEVVEAPQEEEAEPEQASEAQDSSAAPEETSEEEQNLEPAPEENESVQEQAEDETEQLASEDEMESAQEEDEPLGSENEESSEEAEPDRSSDETTPLIFTEGSEAPSDDTLRMDIPESNFSKFSGRLKKIDSILEGSPSSQGQGVDAEGPTVVFKAIPPAASTGVMPSIKGEGPTRFSTSDRDKNSGIPRKALIGLIVAVVAILLLAFVGLRSCNSGTEIPYVVGMQTQEARTRLESAGFNVEVQTEVVDDSFGEVLECSPKGGTRHKDGSTVTLTVSASLTVPEVVGVDLDTARKALEDEGAENIVVKAEASNQPENTVIAVSPEEGEGFDPESEVTLTVASSATVPDVVGLNADEAVSQLEEVGYETDVEWTDSEEPSLNVLSTDPEAGTLANLGSTVKLSVSSPGPSALLNIQEYKQSSSEDDAAYLEWKGFTMAGSYIQDSGYVSELWKADDGTTVSFTSAPYMEDEPLDTTSHMAEGAQFQAVRLYIPSSSSNSQGKDISMTTVKKYMDVCGLDNLADSCDEEDIEYNGSTGSELGLGKFVCAEGTTDDGQVWTILITEDGTTIAVGDYECYTDMYPICDSVAANEILTAQD